MLFTLIHYTTGWQAGPTIELGLVPTVGSLLTLGESSADEGGDGIFYVDNIMYAEGENGNYLFVRPYTGYGKVAPLTESDRVKRAVDTLREELLERIGRSEESAARHTELLRNDLADVNTSLAELASAVDNLTDNLMEQLKAEE